MSIGKPSPAHSVDQTGPSAYRLRYQELFDFAPDPQLVTDLSGVIREANHAASALFQYSKEFLIGKPLGLLISKSARQRFYNCLVNLQAGRADEFECRIDGRSSGTEAILRAIATDRSPIDADSVRWQFQDITLRRHAERTQRDLLQRLVAFQENERRRISREIHDHFGQELTALSFGLKDLEVDIPEGTTGRRRLRGSKRPWTGSAGRLMSWRLTCARRHSMTSVSAPRSKGSSGGGPTSSAFRLASTLRATAKVGSPPKRNWRSTASSRKP